MSDVNISIKIENKNDSCEIGDIEVNNKKKIHTLDKNIIYGMGSYIKQITTIKTRQEACDIGFYYIEDENVIDRFYIDGWISNVVYIEDESYASCSGIYILNYSNIKRYNSIENIWSDIDVMIFQLINARDKDKVAIKGHYYIFDKTNGYTVQYFDGYVWNSIQRNTLMIGVNEGMGGQLWCWEDPVLMPACEGHFNDNIDHGNGITVRLYIDRTWKQLDTLLSNIDPEYRNFVIENPPYIIGSNDEDILIHEGLCKTQTFISLPSTKPFNKSIIIKCVNDGSILYMSTNGRHQEPAGNRIYGLTQVLFEFPELCYSPFVCRESGFIKMDRRGNYIELSERTKEYGTMNIVSTDMVAIYPGDGKWGNDYDYASFQDGSACRYTLNRKEYLFLKEMMKNTEQ